MDARHELEMIGYDEAIEAIEFALAPLAAREVPLAAAAGHALASPCAASVDAPPGDVAARDGFAVAPGPGRRRVTVGAAQIGRAHV